MPPEPNITDPSVGSSIPSSFSLDHILASVTAFPSVEDAFKPLAPTDILPNLVILLGSSSFSILSISKSAITTTTPASIRSRIPPSVSARTTFSRSRSTSTKAGGLPEPLPTDEAVRFGMRMVNASLATLHRMVQSGWKETASSPSSTPVSSSSSRLAASKATPSVFKTPARKPAQSVMAGRNAASSTKVISTPVVALAVNPSRSNLASKDEVEALVMCAAISLERVCQGPCVTAKIALAKAGVSLLTRSNALGLTRLSVSIVETFHSVIIDLYPHAPLPKLETSTPKLSQTQTIARRTPSSRTTTAAAKKIPASSDLPCTPMIKKSQDSAATLRSITFPQADESTKKLDDAVKSVLSAWICTSLAGVISGQASHPGALDAILCFLQTNQALFVHLKASPIPNSNILQLLNVLFSPPNPHGLTSSETLFRLRTISLELMPQLLPSLKQGKVWDQALRSVQIFLRDVEGQEGMKVSLKELRKLISHLQGVWVLEDGFVGKEWERLVDLWGKIAAKVGDLNSLTIIADLLKKHRVGNDGSEETLGIERMSLIESSGGQVEVEEIKSEDDSVLITRVLAEMMKETVLIDKLVKDDDNSRPRTPSTTSTCSNEPFSSTSSISALFKVLCRNHDIKILERAYKTAERFRRQCITFITRSKHKKNLAEESVLKLVEGAERLVSACLAPSTENRSEDGKSEKETVQKILIDFVASSVDTLLVLARVNFSPAESATYASTLHLLNRAIHLRTTLDSLPSSKPLLLECANLSRCISGTAYNCAGGLYKIGEGSQAIRLAEMGCQSGEDALNLVGKLDGLGEEEVWAGLRNGMSRKWELLGSCRNKNGDLKNANSAFVSAVRTLPTSFFVELSTFAKTSPISEFFTLPQLTASANLIHRLTLQAIFDLQLPAEQVSLISALRGSIEEDALGALGEWQLKIMTGSLESEEVGKVVGRVLDDLLNIYEADIHPIRRLRVLAAVAHVGCFVSSGRDIDSVTKDVDALAELDNFKEDSKLALFAPQYRATYHLWTSIYAYCTRAGDQLVLSHASTAAKQLKSLFSSEERIADAIKQPKQPQAQAQTQTLVESVRQPRTRQASANAMKKIKVASPPKKVPAALTRRVVSRSKAVAQVVSAKDCAEGPVQVRLFDQVDQLISLLEMTSSLLGMLGHTLTKIQHLKIIRQITKGDASKLDVFVAASAHLGAAYTKLGKSSRARTTFTSTINSMNVLESEIIMSPAVKVDFLLRYAQFLINEGDEGECLLTYQKAMNDSMMIIEDKAGSARVRDKSLKLERAAVALMVAAAIQKSKNDFATAISSIAQSHRLWTRAADNIARVSPKALDAVTTTKEPANSTETENPFRVTTPAIPVDPASQPSADSRVKTSQSAPLSRLQIGSLSWRISEGLLDCLFTFSSTTIQRGTSRDTEFLLQQAQNYSLAVDSKGLANRALIRKAAVQLYIGQINQARLLLDEAQLGSMTTCGADHAEIAYIEARLRELEDQPEDVLAAYDAGLEVLQACENLFNEENPIQTSRRSSVSRKDEPLHAPLLELLLSQKIITLKTSPTTVEGVSVRQLEVQLEQLPPRLQTQYDRYSYQARTAFLKVLEDFKNDLALCSLTESLISMPMGTSSSGSTVHTKIRKTVDRVITLAEKAYEQILFNNGAHARAQQTRDACLSLSLLRAYKTSLGQDPSLLTIKTAWLLDHNSSTTLRHELLEAIQSKSKAPRDDLVWPVFVESSTSSAAALKTKNEPFQDEDDIYWSQVARRYQDEPLYELDLSIPLPTNWSVINISVTEDLTKLFVTRHRTGLSPLVFSLPLDRHGKREDEEEHFSFTDAIEELEDIVNQSKETGKQAKEIEEREGRAAWWAMRRDLDKRMEELLGNLEFCWLGAFKSIFNPPGRHTSEALDTFRAGLERIFNGSMYTASDKKKASKIHIDDELLLCFATLPSASRDEELEDLVYFILDLYQVHGVDVAVAELDVDEMVLKLRELLEIAEQPKSLSSSDPNGLPHHTFLVLDRKVQPLPWESIKSLRGRSVSRIPSMAFIQDRLLLRKRRFEGPSSSEEDDDEDVDDEDGTPMLGMKALTLDLPKAMPKTPKFTRQPLPSSSPCSSLSQTKPEREGVDQFSFPLNGKRGFYILNPSGDLGKTESYFSSWIQKMDKLGWRGIVGRPPTELEFVNALSTMDIVVYFGHGGAEQYIRSHKIRSLKRCASVMLWGCSSGQLKDYGEFDRNGTPWNYMLAGCPTVVGNLWDVTDKDIDRLSEHVLSLVQSSSSPPSSASGLSSKGHTDNAVNGGELTNGNGTLSRSLRQSSKPTTKSNTVEIKIETSKNKEKRAKRGRTLAEAVGSSRDVCKLKYLTGAAPVVYGIPVEFEI
ncbi:Regulator of spindle pole body duplication [Phaffia rhodozyma]|uniref:separase n=1 Tax=Phaffia rhodozyma TaxID=264483 RepID=A0A0F7SH04_PHARH|nr:Regulator of spindle pole body duplication [Phaffia rhodozyma]